MKQQYKIELEKKTFQCGRTENNKTRLIEVQYRVKQNRKQHQIRLK